jgi:lysophospholipase L1-like esterase
MSRLPSAVCLLAAAVLTAGCGAQASSARITAARTSGAVAPAAGLPAPPLLTRAGAPERVRERTLAGPAAATVPAAQQGPVATAAAAASAATAAQAATASDEGSNPIVALGDSITFGWGRGASPVAFGPAPTHSYPWYMARDLQVPVVNAGISGTTAREVLDPSTEPNHPRPTPLQLPALLALHPRLMIVSFGSNEVQRGWPMWQTAADLNRLLARINDAGVPMVLVGTHVDCFISACPAPGPGYGRQRYLSNWDATLTQLAGRYQAELVLDVEHGFTADDLTDWIHPTAIGYWRMAQRIERAAVSVLERQSQRTPGGHPAPRLPDHNGWAPPSGGTPDGGRRDPRSQSEMWPGGPRDDGAWSLDRVLSWLGVLGVTVPEPSVTATFRGDVIG